MAASARFPLPAPCTSGPWHSRHSVHACGPWLRIHNRHMATTHLPSPAQLVNLAYGGAPACQARANPDAQGPPRPWMDLQVDEYLRVRLKGWPGSLLLLSCCGHGRAWARECEPGMQCEPQAAASLRLALAKTSEVAAIAFFFLAGLGQRVPRWQQFERRGWAAGACQPPGGGGRGVHRAGHVPAARSPCFLSPTC